MDHIGSISSRTYLVHTWGMTKPTQTDPQFKLRLPDRLRDQIKAASDANNRSMNAEIVSRLEESFRGRERVANLSINIDLSDLGQPELKEKLAMLDEHLEAAIKQHRKPR